MISVFIHLMPTPPSGRARHLVLLPGLDGTGTLFEDFLRAAPAGFRLDVISLPPDVSEYPRLAEIVGPTIERLPFAPILLAESFSGPLAIQLAARYEIEALILCNSFVVAPYPRLLRALIQPTFFPRGIPRAFVRHYLVGRRASNDLVERVRRVISKVPSSVLAARVRSVLSVDVRNPLARCKAPIQYLRGIDDRLIHERSVDALVKGAKTVVSVARLHGPHLLLQVEPVQVWRAIEHVL